MQKFDRFTAVAAPLPMINIDTDMIIPKQYLKTIKRTGLGVHLFDEMRRTQDGQEIPDFILNRDGFRQAGILIAGDNFGCGSSREHAPWALLDYGFRVVIAPSFADIFYNNCFKNGILPIRLPEAEIEPLLAQAKGGNHQFTVDLPAQTITAPDGTATRFELDAFRKKCLVEGLDDIGLTLQKASAIGEFEHQQTADKPWLYRQA